MVNRNRVRIAISLISVGLIGLVAAAYLAFGATHSPALLGPSRVTAPIITDQGTGLLVSGALTGPTSRGIPIEGARVRMPELGIDLPIIEGDGQNVPLYKAAHYPGMAWPGQGGRALLYAHARPGMFGPLFAAKIGQKVEVQGSDGRVLRYVIKQYFPRWPDTDLSILQPTDHEQLVLLTCTSWNSSDPRIIAIAEPL